MNPRKQRILVGTLAFAAVALILANVRVDADFVAGGNDNGKGKGQVYKFQECPDSCSVTDVCDPTVDPQWHVCSNNKSSNGAFAATFACCCCGDAPLGKYYGGSPK